MAHKNRQNRPVFVLKPILLGFIKDLFCTIGRKYELVATS